jgi:serine/threonine protein kinase
MARDLFGFCGTLIENQFRVDRAAGEGGLSVVYSGAHLGLNERIAIKCLKLTSAPTTADVEAFTHRFRDEARIAYRLSQGNLDIVRSVAAGTAVAPSTGAIVPYMILEWLDGRSLAQDFMQRRSQQMRGRTIDETIALLDPAARALAYAHEQGVIHRDVKPGNLFLAQTRAGERMKVLDFGLAKVVTENALGIIPSVQTFGTMTVACSPAYGAPEQMTPSAGTVGPWTDVYSFALVMLEMLRDARVRTGEGIAQCAVQALAPDYPVTCHALGISVRPQVEVALARAVAIDIAMRPKTMGELWDLVVRAAGRSIPPKMSTPQPAPPDEQRTVWDPRAGPEAFESTAAFGSSHPPPALNQTALMLDAPPRVSPAASTRGVELPPGATPGGTLPLAHSPTIPSQPPPSLAPAPAPAPAPTPAPAPAPAPNSGAILGVLAFALVALAAIAFIVYRVVLARHG